MFDLLVENLILNAVDVNPWPEWKRQDDNHWMYQICAHRRASAELQRWHWLHKQSRDSPYNGIAGPSKTSRKFPRIFINFAAYTCNIATEYSVYFCLTALPCVPWVLNKTIKVIIRHTSISFQFSVEKLAWRGNNNLSFGKSSEKEPKVSVQIVRCDHYDERKWPWWINRQA